MLIKSLCIPAVVAVTLAGATAAKADITVYSAGPANLIHALATGFTAKTGIKAHVFQATTGRVMARIEAEADNPVADVLVSASWETATDFAARGWLLPYRSPNAENMPAALKTDTAVAEGVAALAIAWNPKSGTPKPTDWSDLAKPAFKNLVTIPDPARSGSSYELVAGLVTQTGGWKLFEDLHANGAVVAAANAQALNPVLQGAKAAVFGAVDYISLARQKKGESVEVLFPASGTIIAPRPMMILKWTKHRRQAERFVDYVLSQQGQAAVAKVYLIPARSDVRADRPLMRDIKLMPVDPAALASKRRAILARFGKIFGH